ncbi:short chain dehydrogenase [Hamiltosporidium tvaerminnensis]|uniref:Short chain dehydrogenase n=1 Tax=Hamiltosporidium tvaerminnensis TaxID=1176355 RepID=A0A4Q9L444_9MICR|nr:3-dehydrosphinganine reductase [Hamiltosporidium tvaerminnensis]TBU01300.1 short chain dehydrogenase [Hamiltosporidium tvaerminnensis]TBU11734.1 short chain dehydrogenase [Hamiltosporidium tvaerminnensis]
MWVYLVGIPILICIGVYVGRGMSRRSINFKNKKVLIIGGTSGLGLALAIEIQKRKGDVTVAARRFDLLKSIKEKHGFSVFVADAVRYETLECLGDDYDFVFNCAGICYPGYFEDLDVDVFKKSMEINYFGTVNTLMHFYNNNKRPFGFVMVSSTLSFYSFPGYSSYSPCKAAINSLFDSLEMEMARSGVFLYVYYVSTIKSRGYDEENKNKPEFTKDIEGRECSKSCSPEERAKHLLNSMYYNNRIVSDVNTRLLKVAGRCDSVLDFLFLPLALVLVPFWKLYVKIKFFYF